MQCSAVCRKRRQRSAAYHASAAPSGTAFFPVDIAEEERRLQPTPFMQHLETNRGHLMRSAGTKGMVLHWFEMGGEIWLSNANKMAAGSEKSREKGQVHTEKGLWFCYLTSDENSMNLELSSV